MFPTLLHSLPEVYSCTTELLGRKSSLNDCTLLYFSELMIPETLGSHHLVHAACFVYTPNVLQRRKEYVGLASRELSSAFVCVHGTIQPDSRRTTRSHSAVESRPNILHWYHHLLTKPYESHYVY